MIRFIVITDVRFDGQEERWIFQADLSKPAAERRVVLVSYGRRDEHGNQRAQWNDDSCYPDGRIPVLERAPGVPAGVLRAAQRQATREEVEA